MHRFRRLIAAAPLPFILAFAGPARAQFADVDSHYSQLVAGNVEAKRGVFSYQQADLTVGSGPFPRSLSFQRYIRILLPPYQDGVTGVFNGTEPELGGFHHNFEVLVTCDDGIQSNYPTGCGDRLVRIGAQTFRFKASVGGVFTSYYNDGTTLDQYPDRFVFTSPDGDVITFPISAGYFQWAGTTNLAQTWQKANGDFLTFYYDFAMSGSGGWNDWHRLAKVINSQGYGFIFSYLSPGGGSDHLNLTNADFRKLTVSQVSSIGPTCPSGCGQSVSYSYSDWVGGNAPTVRLDSLTDAKSQTSYFTWNADRYLASQSHKQNAAALLFQNTFVNGIVTQQIDAAGNTWLYSRTTNAGGQVLSSQVEDPIHHVTKYTFDPLQSAPSTITDPNNNVTTFTYDATSGRVTSIKYPEGNIDGYTYDARGNVTNFSQTTKDGSQSRQIVYNFPVTCTNRSTCNQPASITDARGNQANFTYDPTHGGVTTITGPAQVNGIQPQKRFGYGIYHGAYVNTTVSVCRTTASCANAADETRTTFGYGGPDLNATSVTTAAGDGSVSATSNISYDAVGNLASQTDPTGATTQFRYDARRQLIGVVGPDPDGGGSLKNRGIRYTYNPDGQTTAAEQGTTNGYTDTDWNAFAPLQRTDVGYDGAGRVASRQFSAGGTAYNLTQTNYDPLSRTDCVAVRMNPTTFGAAPTDACLQTTTGSYGPDRITRQSYDPGSRPTGMVEAYGTTLARTSSLSYTPNGRVSVATDPKGNSVAFSYDGYDRLLTTCFASTNCATATDYEQLTYDGNDNIVQRRIRNSLTIGYTFDNLNRLISESLPASVGNANPTFTYDSVGNLVGATNANGTFSTGSSFGYDALGRKVSEGSLYNGGGSITATMQYDAAGRRTRFTWPDGLYVTYDHDAVGETTAMRENGATLLGSFTYDDLGQMTGKSMLNGTGEVFIFDPASRLSGIGLTGSSTINAISLLNYSPANELGSRSNSNDAYAFTGSINGTTSYSTNALNQYTVAGGTVTHDPKGNTTAFGATALTWNAENVLITGNGGTFTSDALQRLTYLSATALRFNYDGDRVVGLYDASNNLLRRFVYGPGALAPSIWYETSGTTDRRYLDTDERGSVIRVTNGAGSTMRINTYDEYGLPGSTNLGRFQFTGQVWLPEISSYYLKRRIYSPVLGRFLQPDPSLFSDGPNLYQYTHNDPIDGVDPDGAKAVYGPVQPPVGSAACGYCDASAVYGGQLSIIRWTQRWADQTYSAGGPIGSTTTAPFGYGGIDNSGIIGSLVANAPVFHQKAGNSPPVDLGGGAYQLTNIDCSWGGGLFLRAAGDALVDVGGYGTAVGGAGMAAGTALGAYGAFTGNIPAAGVGAIATMLSTPIAAGGATIQGGGALLSFIGGRSSQALLRNASAAIVDRIPLAPSWVKSGLKFAAKRLSNYIPDVRTCNASGS